MEELKEPVVALLISPDAQARHMIHRETKTLTIREGWRDYRPGQLLALCCEKLPWAVMAKITSVRHCLLAELTFIEVASDGYANHAHAVKELKKYYPSIGLQSKVTVIRWENPRGYWVDHPDEYLAYHQEMRSRPDLQPV